MVGNIIHACVCYMASGDICRAGIRVKNKLMRLEKLMGKKGTNSSRANSKVTPEGYKFYTRYLLLAMNRCVKFDLSRKFWLYSL